MHELGVTQEVLNIALSKAKEAGAKKVCKVSMVIGDSSGIVDDSVQLCFELLSQDSIASGAEISFRHIPTTVRCRRCDISFTAKKDQWACPTCGGWDVEMETGKEFYIESIEVD